MHINKLSAKRVHWGTKNKGQDNQWRLEKRTQTKDDYFTILHKNHKETTVFVEILPQKKKIFLHPLLFHPHKLPKTQNIKY